MSRPGAPPPSHVSADAGGEVRADVVVDAVVVGDGPAGSALASACARRGVDVVLLGTDRPWTATYASWVDELAAVELVNGVDLFATRVESVVAYGGRRHDLERPYGVIDNGALRAALRAGVERVDGQAGSVSIGVTSHSVGLHGGGRVRARLVIDATGAGGWSAVGPAATAAAVGRSGLRRGGRGHDPAWQTAYGVVLAEPPAGDLGTPTLMDFRDPAGWPTEDGPATFVYALPVADGWLVEETVLAARPAVDPAPLAARLAARLGTNAVDMAAAARRTEIVRIPMGGRLPDRRSPVVRFGAAAGYVHPATGFSVAASLRAAGRVADAIGEALAASGDLAADPRPVHDAVWPAAARRSRVLHDYGLDVVTRMSPPAVCEFFDRFFELPEEEWASYLRIDTPPRTIARVMRRLFTASGGAMRWRLMTGNPLRLAGVLHPQIGRRGAG